MTRSATVSIVILNWNKPEMTVDCVESVFSNTAGHDFEVIVVDNGSEPANREILGENLDDRAKLVALERNRYFGEGNNIGAERASGDTLVFLNNDVIVEPGWLGPLLRHLEDDSIGAVGPMFLYPDGRIQEVGAYVTPRGDSVQAGKLLSLPDLRFEEPRAVDYVSAACLAIRKADFEHVGGFHYAYEPAYYEDTELCFAIRALGKSVIVDPSSRVIHFEHQTTKAFNANGALAGVVPANQELFVRRRDRGLIALEANAGLTDALGEHSKCGAAGTAALYTPYVLTPGGGEKYLLTLASRLHQHGYHVTLLLDEVYSHLRIAKIARELNLANPICDCRKFADHRVSPDFFVAMGNHVVPDVPPIGKTSVFHCQFPFPAAQEMLEKAKGFPPYDLVVVNSTFTEEWFVATAQGEGLPSVQTFVLNPPVDNLVPTTQGPKRKSKSIISIGRFFVDGHSKNHGLMIDAFRELATRVPDATLTLIGSSTHNPADKEYLARLRQMSKGLNIQFLVDASREEVQESIWQGDVYWHAAGMNVNHYRQPEALEHFGISVVEAMYAGLVPIVYYKGGPALTVRDGVDGLHYRSVEELVEQTIGIFTGDEVRSGQFRSNAYERADDFSLSRFNQGVDEILNKLSSQKHRVT